MPLLMKKFNLLMSQTIERDSNTVVINNILSNYSWNKKDFVDEGHFSRIGGEKFIEIIQKQNPFF